MALIRRCDRCDADNEERHGKRVMLVDHGAVMSQFGGTELCDRCIEQLKEWLRPIPKAAPKAVASR